ncbi:MAG: DUF5658 family protein [Woeseiaceae bacterium]
MGKLGQADELDETRFVTDRRAFSWRTVLHGFIRSRRRDSRRGDEAEPLFTDWHHPWLFVLSVGIMLMSALDAFFTLQLLELGAIEINPIMAFVIGDSVLAFSASKMVLTGFGILSLVYLSRIHFLDRLRTGLVLTMFFSGYAALICYEFVNLINRW